MTGPQSQAPITSPVTYEELTHEHKQKYDEVKAQFKADLIGSFERTRNHGIRWKGFSPEGALDNVLSVETHRRAATGNTKSREVAEALAGTAPSSTARNSSTRHGL